MCTMNETPAVIHPAELDIEDDPGTNWHPRSDKDGAWGADGHLADLTEGQAAEHAEKPEADEQYDGVRRRAREEREPGAAEDSDHSEPGKV